MSDNNTAVITIEEVEDYLGIDYEDSMTVANINRAIDTADAYLCGAIGDDYPKEDARAKELALIIIADLFDNRGMSGTVSNNVSKLVNDFSLQLKMELRRSSSE